MFVFITKISIKHELFNTLEMKAIYRCIHYGCIQMTDNYRCLSHKDMDKPA